MIARDRILYVSADGLLQPLGYSQVYRVVEGLASRGVPYAVVSLERREDLADAERVAAIRSRLSRLGVDWTPIPYRAGRAGAASNLAALIGRVVVRARRGDVRLIHARSYHGALAGLAAKTACGVPYLFDARGYWVDERLDAGRWFRNPLALRTARAVETRLYREAAGAVTLTALQADDLRGGLFGAWNDRPLETIPTCADFDVFRIRERTEIAPELRRFAGDDPVIGFVGSANASYRLDRAVDLLDRILRSDRRWKVVALSADPRSYAALFERAGVEPARVLLRRVEHEHMPEWIPGLDWGFLLLSTSPAKRASMPTKLAEFFAAGVRPLHHGCNSEVAEWIARTGSGHSLPDLSDESLRAAAEIVARTPRDLAVLERARERAIAHFSLASGVARYERLLRSLGR